MLDLADWTENDSKIPVIETNHGVLLEAPEWPTDTDFELVVFSPLENTCDVVRAGDLAADIASALSTLEKTVTWAGEKPDWYRRLERCAAGASIT